MLARLIVDLLLNAMPFVAILLDDHPMVGHGILAVLVGHGKLGVDDPALIGRSLDPLPVVVHVLVGTDDRVQAHHLPGFGEEHIFPGARP